MGGELAEQETCTFWSGGSEHGVERFGPLSRFLWVTIVGPSVVVVGVLGVVGIVGCSGHGGFVTSVDGRNLTGRVDASCTTPSATLVIVSPFYSAHLTFDVGDFPWGHGVAKDPPQFALMPWNARDYRS